MTTREVGSTGSRAPVRRFLRRFVRPSVVVPVAIVLLVGGVILLGAAAGLRVFQIVSPSMGQTLPVGSAVITQPRSDYRVGEIVTFHQNGRIYTHRLSGRVADGFTTRGDLNSSNDAWVVDRSEIVGAVVVRAAGVGWLLQALPWALLGLAIIVGLSCLPFMPKGWRWAIRIAGGCLLFGVLAFWLRPWVSLELLGYTPSSHGGVLMRVVNTGLFDANAHGTVLSSGESAVVHLTRPGPHGRYTLVPTAAMSTGQKIAAAVLALSPLLLSLAVGYRPSSRHGGTTAVPSRLPKTALVAVATAVVGMLVVGQVLSFASLTASVTNSADTAGVPSLFSCTVAATSMGSNTPSGSWTMNNTHSSGTTETDLSGNGNTGTYAVTPTFSTGSPQGCKHDAASSVIFNGTSQCLTSATTIPFGSSPGTPFTIMAWFKTSTNTGMKIIGMSGSNDAYHDRHIYLDQDGRLVFGIYGNNTYTTIATPAGTDYSDGSWHHAAATLSSSGLFLYADGVLVASKAMTNPVGMPNDGVWRIGCGILTSWPSGSGGTVSASNYFTGNIQFAQAYSVPRTAAQIQAIYQAGS